MNERQLRFIKALAKFLTEDEVGMSVKLQMKKPEAQRWADLRDATNLSGYYEGEEGRMRAEADLSRMLYPEG